MVRTRVGYAGGRKPRPSYYAMGDHTECLEIDYDSKVVGLEELLQVYLRLPHVHSRTHSRQYRNVIFYRHQDEKDLARALMAREQAKYVDLEPFHNFTAAEDYHQKYYLQDCEVMEDYASWFPDFNDFNDSTAVARANAYVAGYGKASQVREDLPKLGLTAKGQQRLVRLHGSPGFQCY